MNKKRVIGLSILLIFLGVWTASAQWGGAGAWGTIRSYFGNFNADLVPSADNTYDIGSTSKGIKNLYVSGILSATGTTESSGTTFIDNNSLSFGNDLDAQMRWWTTGNDHLQINTEVNADTASGYITVVEKSDKDHANRQIGSNTIDPTIRIFSGDETQSGDYIDTYHDQSNGVVRSGGGGLQLYAASTLYFASSGGMVFSVGGTSSMYFRQSTSQDCINWCLADDTGNQLVLANYTNRDTDYGHNTTTNPTLYIHSDTTDTTEWLSFAHDQTNPVIGWGKGLLSLPNGSTVVEADETKFSHKMEVLIGGVTYYIMLTTT